MKDATMPDYIYCVPTDDEIIQCGRESLYERDITYIRADLATQQPEGEAGEARKLLNTFIDVCKANQAEMGVSSCVVPQYMIEQILSVISSPTPSLESAVKGLEGLYKNIECSRKDCTGCDHSRNWNAAVQACIEAITGKSAA